MFVYILIYIYIYIYIYIFFFRVNFLCCSHGFLYFSFVFLLMTKGGVIEVFDKTLSPSFYLKSFRSCASTAYFF